MEPVFRQWPLDLVRKNFRTLLESCNPAELADRLFEEELLSSRELKLLDRDLRVKAVLDEDVNRQLFLEILPNKGPGAFDKFARVLVNADPIHKALFMRLEIPDEFKDRMRQLVALLGVEAEMAALSLHTAVSGRPVRVSTDNEFAEECVSTEAVACTQD